MEYNIDIPELAANTSAVDVHDERCVSHPFPLGPMVSSGGTNFSVFSANAKRVEIVFFDHADALQPSRVITLDPVVDRTSHYWHIFVPAIRTGQLYGFRVD